MKRMSALRYAKKIGVDVLFVPKGEFILVNFTQNFTKLNTVYCALGRKLLLDKREKSPSFFKKIKNKIIDWWYEDNIDSWPRFTECDEYNNMCLYKPKGSVVNKEDIFIVYSECVSQTFKDCGLWHEIGHLIDFMSVGFDSKRNVLHREATASMIAIILMKKHNMFTEKRRQILLNAYDTYGKNILHSHEKCYRFLIEEA